MLLLNFGKIWVKYGETEKGVIRLIASGNKNEINKQENAEKQI